MNSQTINIASTLYERTIRDAFIAHAGEKDPDPEAIREVQRAMVQFVKNFVTQGLERTQEREKVNDKKKVQPEDILAQFESKSKYLDACAKMLLSHQMSTSFRQDAKGSRDLDKKGAEASEISSDDLMNEDN